MELDRQNHERLAGRMDKHKLNEADQPANKRKFDVIVVGSGLAGASERLPLAEKLG